MRTSRDDITSIVHSLVERKTLTKTTPEMKEQKNC